MSTHNAQLARPSRHRAVDLRGARASLSYLKMDRDRRLQRSFRVRRFAGAQAHEEQLDHLRVAHLTDLHVGRLTPLRVQLAAVRLANDAKPDLVVLTGDFVCYSKRYLGALEQTVRAFEAPVICTLGNHDHWTAPKQVRVALRRAGAAVLDNAHTVITLRNQRLQVVGLDDAHTGHADVAAAVRGLRRDLPTLGLSHIAEQADALWHHGVPLVLSGHTHAGQLSYGRLHELTVGRIAGHKYVHGLYGSRQTGAVYVGAGVGTSVVPFRLGDRAKREVTLFELGLRARSFAEPDTEQRPLPGRAPRRRRIRKRRAG